jgi:hypothetical protein
MERYRAQDCATYPGHEVANLDPDAVVACGLSILATKFAFSICLHIEREKECIVINL